MGAFIRFASVFFALAIAAAAQADKPFFGDTFMIALGGMENKAKASFQSTREGRPPVELDMNDLGMDPTTTTVWAGLAWQFADKWGVSTSYSSFSSDGEVFASEGGNFGEIEWEVNATLESKLDLDLYIVDFHWDFINTGQSHFGVGLGLHIADISTGINATVELNVDGTPSTEPPILIGQEIAAVTAPLPNVSVRGGHRFGDSIYLGGTAGYFTLKVGDVDGELVTVRGHVEWRPGGGNFGLGAGYQYVSMNVTEKTTNFSKKFDMEFYGPLLFVSLGF